MLRKIVCVLIFAACGTLAFAGGQTAKPAATAVPAAMDKISYATWHFYQNADSEQAFEKRFKEDTGVTLDVVNFPKESWQDKVQALFVSGDATDASLVPSNIVPLVKQGFLVPIDDYIEKHPGFKLIKQESPQVFREAVYNGKIYGIADGDGFYMNLWVRKDWLDKLGLKMPTSMDQVVAMLEAFKNADFNKGKNIIPLVMASSIWPHDVFANYWGVFNEVVKKDGKWQDFELTPEFKEYLDFLKNLYTRGLLDKEMPTTGYGDVRKKGGAGIAGAAVIWDDTYDSFAKGLQDNKLEGEFAIVPPFKGPKGVFGLSNSPPGVGYAVTSKAANPEFVFNTFLDWFYIKNSGVICTSRGVEGFDFTVVNGVMTPTKLPNSGVGFHGQKFPPIKIGFEYPFKFDAISQGEYDNIKQVKVWAKPFRAETDKIYMPKDVDGYWAIQSDLYSKKTSLMSKYVIGEMSYDALVKEYTQYINEIQLPKFIEEANKMGR